RRRRHLDLGDRPVGGRRPHRADRHPLLHDGPPAPGRAAGRLSAVAKVSVSKVSAEPHHLPVARRMTNLRSSAIRDLLKVTERDDVISLAGGLPAPDSFPVEELRAITERVLRERPLTLLQYSTTEGSRELRAWIAGQAALDRGRPVDP